MISFLEGTIEHLGDKYAVLNTGGIGYKVTLSPRVLNIIAKIEGVVNPVRGKTPLKLASAGYASEASRTSNGARPTVRLYVHSQLNMREGTFDMYGFDKKGDLDLFHLLTTVSGIGPKGAMNILGSVEPLQLKVAVVNQDADYLKKVSTLGPKVAQRLVLELKGKVDHLEGETEGIDLGQDGQATEALLVLGYSQAEAKEALKGTKAETLQERVREALKILAKK
ncbi:MAG: Holliday junction branch migration protein RuvA [Patescibacteria group bacterium]